MKFNAKYNFKDVVHRITFSQKKHLVKCPFCDGVGRITGQNSDTRQCPECYGRPQYEFEDSKWFVAETLTIGEVRVKARCEHKSEYDTIFDNYGDQSPHYEEEYMCYETGIGSGTIWSVDKIFPTAEEAQKECDRLNKEQSTKGEYNGHH